MTMVKNVKDFEKFNNFLSEYLKTDHEFCSQYENKDIETNKKRIISFLEILSILWKEAPTASFSAVINCLTEGENSEKWDDGEWLLRIRDFESQMIDFHLIRFE